jgi:MYXO-CTERM domain-containing protein
MAAMASHPRRGRLLRASVHATLGAALLVVPTPARAEPCNVPSDCDTGFCVDGQCCDAPCTDPCHACSAAAKGTGMDGVCELKVAGKVCIPSHCEAPLSYLGDAFCDAVGNCMSPQLISCFLNDPCKIELCDPSAGCDSVTKNDGTDCGGGMVCVNGVCGGQTVSSAASTSSSSSGGTTGMGGGGAGGAGGVSESGGGDPYPPNHARSGCGCRTSDEAPRSASFLAAIAAIAAIGLRRRRGAA